MCRAKLTQCSSSYDKHIALLFGILKMLSAIVRFITSALMGLVFNKVRNAAADELKKRGDVAYEKLRDVIVEDLNDIKTKLNGDARKYLLASCEFLEAGIVTLNLALDEAKNEQSSKNEPNGIKTRNEFDSGVLDVAIELSFDVQKLKSTSNSRLVAAKERFKAAREKATEAFCNEALSLPDRIQATKLRVVSQILECFQDTKAAAAGCILFLKNLHNLPAIGETFSTYFKGGIKSRIYKDSRLENVKSVLSLNFAVLEFIARTSGELPDVTNWPRIHLPIRGETIHPLVIDYFIVKKILDNKELQLPENQLISNKLSSWFCCINSKGEFLLVDQHANCIIILNKSGDMKIFCKLRQATANPGGAHQRVTAFTIDRYDNVFLIIQFKDGTSNKYVYVLFVFDSAGNEQQERVLELRYHISVEPSITLNLCVVNNDIFIHTNFDDSICICSINGYLKSRLSLEQNSSHHSGEFISMQCVTDDDNIVMRTRQNVLVYTKEGKLKRAIKVKNNIEAVTYNYVTSKIEVLVKKELILGTTSYHILSYSDSDEVECLHLPLDINTWCLDFFQYAAGSTALMIRKDPYNYHIIFI